MATRLSIANTLAELRSRQEADLERRRRAQTILAPDAVRPGSKTAIGVLQTTLGGVMRPITAQDLVTFRRNVTALGDKLERGLTAQEVIDGSRTEDLQRARAEIRNALPVRLTEGTCVFVTNSGPHSNVVRHFCRLEFVNYSAALARPETPFQAAGWLARHARLRFECDCGRWTFWLRFIATVGGYVAGRHETGFPKIRNPELAGVACKHLLRVMVSLQEPIARQALTRMLQADRDRLEGAKASAKPRVITTSRAAADKALQAQAARARSISTSDERQRRALAAGIRKALPRTEGTATDADLRQTLAALQARPDITAKAILSALNTVLERRP